MGWSSQELSGIELGDVRLDLRLMEMVERLSEQLEKSLPEAFGSWAELKGAYRLWENGRVRWQAILEPHVASTAKRGHRHPVVLAIQDTTEINLTHHPATTGLGYLSRPNCRGVLLHTCLAVTPVGQVLGVLDQQMWARPLEEYGKKRHRHRRATCQKESQRWIDGLAAIGTALAGHPQVVVVADRESDFYDFFNAPRSPGVEFLIRVAQQSRRVQHEEETVKKALEATAVAGIMLVDVPRAPGRKARQAQLSVRFLQLACGPPQTRSREVGLPNVSLNWILVEEQSPPAHVQPIRWLLATTLPVDTLEDAARCVGYYARRWLIERWHYTLKSGCQVEERLLESLDNIERMLATMSIVAWRVMWLVYESRENPDQPCTVILCEPEWQALHAVTHRRRPQPLPSQPPTLKEAVRMIAMLGGFLGRKGDGDPGIKTVWKGLARLSDITTGWLINHPATVASSEDYG
jgi:Transposase DNA-binding/Transposase Tn5 dimerisation domain